MSRTVRTLVVAALCTVTIGFTGCAWGPNNAKQEEPVGKQKVVCVRDAPTGSHISQMVCYKKQDVNARRENDREKVRNMQIGGAVVPAPTGN